MSLTLFKKPALFTADEQEKITGAMEQQIDYINKATTPKKGL